MKILNLIVMLLVFLSCQQNHKEVNLPYSHSDFETDINGKSTKLFVLQNESGMILTLTNYGAKIVSIYAPDRNQEFKDVVLGFNSIADYKKYGASHGAVVGPYANRIASARFEIDGVVYELPANNGQASLHSGPDSWYRRVWDYEQHENAVVFKLESPDMEYGFPGNKTATVTYTLTDDNEVRIDYKVVTDKPTHINLTNHSYFNLKGEGQGDILDHVLVINADSVTAADQGLIPTGEIIDVKGTSLDFTAPIPIGEKINDDNTMLQIASGYDFNYVLNKEQETLAFAAGAYDPVSGRYMEVYTTEPGLQLYTGNHLQGSETGNSGTPYSRFGGFCLETQHFPDSPNKQHFPSTLLMPGNEFNSTTIYKFSVKN